MKIKKTATKEKKKVYGGIDLHKSSSVIHLMDEEENRVTSKRVITNYARFVDFFSPYLEDYEIIVAIETGNLTFWLCDILHSIGIKTYVVNTRANKAISQSSKKTDKRDARTLALQLKKDMLPLKVYEPRPEERELRSLVRHREQLVKDRTRISNRAFALLTRRGIFINKRDLNQYSRYWEIILEKQSLDPQSMIYFEFISYMDQYMLACKQIKELEKTIEEKSKELNSEYYELLEDQPGVGPATKSVVIAYCNNLERFKSCRNFSSYQGLTPKVRESGDKKRTYSMPITKEGVSILRAYLTQGALAILRSNKKEAEPYKEWFNKIKEKKGWKKARIALARKIGVTIYGVLKNKKPFDPNLVKCRS